MQRCGLRTFWADRAAQLLALGVAVLLFIALHVCLQIPPLQPSPYNSYTLQALAWREGRVALNHDVPYLELAVYQGKYYVSFPPVPGIPVFLLSLLFGDRVPDGLLVKLYALIACAALCRLLLRRGWRPLRAAAAAFLLCFASSLLPLLLTGAVWYQAQVLGFMLTVLAIERMEKGHPLPALVCFALAVGCRPLNVLYGPALFDLYGSRLRRRGANLSAVLRGLVPGIAAGLCVAAVLGWYNFIRFGDLFEFGHSYLPEFSTQGGLQFSFSHIGRNIGGFVFSWPFEEGLGGWTLKRFGFSLFLANPALLWLLFDFYAALVLKKARPNVWVMLLAALHLLWLLAHRTFGGFQYGARYAVDLLPYAALYLTNRQPGPRSLILMACLLSAGLAMAIAGSLLVLLPG